MKFVWLFLTIMVAGQWAAADQVPSALEADPSGWEDIMPPAELTGWSRVPVPPGDPLGQPQWRVEDSGKVLIWTFRE